MDYFFEIMKNTIKNGGYKLEDYLERIYVMYVETKITKEQKDELDNLARENANVDSSIDIMEKLKELDLRVTNLEKNKSEEPTEPVEEYLEFVKDKWYYNGDKITYMGKKYICIAPAGQVCVWSPDGYPPYWEEVVETKQDDNAETQEEATDTTDTTESEDNLNE